MKNSLKIFLILALIASQLFLYSQYRPVSIPDNITEKTPESAETIRAILSLLDGDQQKHKETLKRLEDNWNDGYIPMLLDVIYLSGRDVNQWPTVHLIQKKTRKKFGNDIFGWFEWLWNKDQKILPYQGDWMAEIYKNIDPRFEKYFKDRTESSLIRLDEVRWGGVQQDGIPPLRGPRMLAADEADYLEDDNIVFGISINGDHRAYPKRILAWHEMFVDEVGGKSIAGVYCTLCGTVIAYDTEFEGRKYDLGTSGFLYRSNKLMYDQATQSLWNTIEGKPVIGPLAGTNIELESYSVVTTTWGEWKNRHPETTVLSLRTGHRRDYDEGVAYADYFGSDRLMFNVPELDDRLKNKDEVLIVRAKDYKKDPLAISAKFLARKNVYQNKIGDTKFVVLTDESGGNRVYESKGIKFKKMKDGKVNDSNGISYEITEEQLIGSNGTTLDRLPYHRIFWFAWYNTYKDTRLVK